MSTQGFKDQFNLNSETIARFAGFAPLSPPINTKECRHCDCVDGEHRCLVCSEEISERGCIKRDGLCCDCYYEKTYNEKQGEL